MTRNLSRMMVRTAAQQVETTQKGIRQGIAADENGETRIGHQAPGTVCRVAEGMTVPCMTIARATMRQAGRASVQVTAVPIAADMLQIGSGMAGRTSDPATTCDVMIGTVIKAGVLVRNAGLGQEQGKMMSKFTGNQKVSGDVASRNLRS